MLGTNTFIEIVFSRWDLLEEKEEKEVHKKFVEEVKKEINKKIKETHKNVIFFNIASRPNNTELLQFGYGINEIFPIWVEKSPFIYNKLKDNTSQKSISTRREFSKYKYL